MLASDRTEECELRTELTESLPAVRADAEQLRQVLINLVRNAVQAMGGQGTVEVTTRRRSERASTVMGRDAVAGHSDWVEIAVRDRGPGIAVEELDRVFDKFYRGKRTKDKVKGTGMGLSIARGIVDPICAPCGWPCAAQA